MPVHKDHKGAKMPPKRTIRDGMHMMPDGHMMPDAMMKDKGRAPSPKPPKKKGK